MAQDTISLDQSADRAIARRPFLAALGAGAAMGLAGCVGSADTPSGGDAIDPQFIFVGPERDAPAPVEPDHEVGCSSEIAPGHRSLSSTSSRRGCSSRRGRS